MIRHGDLKFEFKEQELILTPEKAIYWSNKNSLVLSDLHLGKSGHFRKHGVPIPDSLNNENLTRLDTLIKHFNPERILFLGDLFHSSKNLEWNTFADWRSHHESISMLLAIGNHDFYPIEEYTSLGLICSSHIEVKPFLLTHDFDDVSASESSYVISGHVHPSVKLKGKGPQKMRLPCFYFGKQHALLPAFGSFTGAHTIKPAVEEHVFAVTPEQIIDLT
jgi:DNA ligase-associated metallophosphoesterase